LDNLVKLSGDEIEYSDLISEKAIQFYDAIHASSYCTLIHIKRFESNDVISFITDVEHPQYPKNDIRKNEPIAVLFDHNDVLQPSVFSLRNNFPVLPHTITTDFEYPKWLCIYEDDWEEIKLEWTAIQFLERIRKWLALSAKGKLHADDQPLEQFLMTSTEYIIIDKNILEKIENDYPPPLKVIANKEDIKTTYIVSSYYSTKDTVKHTLVKLKGDPVVHGVINKRPKSLYDLDETLQITGINLIKFLREIFPKWRYDKNLSGILEACLILLIEIPLKRKESSEVEKIHRFAFLINYKIQDIGKGIGIWDFHENLLVDVVPINLELNGETLKVETLNPLITLDAAAARNYSGVKDSEVKKITAIGLGAIGSQIFLCLLRMGYDNWSIFDNDILLPHNLARHALMGFNVGWDKGISLEQIGNNILNSDKVKYFSKNILHESAHTDELKQVYKDSDILLDMSASVPVGRFISLNIESAARRVSVFLNPKGNDGIMLFEDIVRKYPLDYLEMLYYRLLLNTGELHNHFEQDKGRIRYANSCRDSFRNFRKSTPIRNEEW